MAACLALALLAGRAAAQPALPQGAGPATSPPPLADTLTGVAKVEYEGGKTLYQLKDYTNALIKFQRAYELSNDPRLLWNVALCARDLGRYTHMIAALKKYRESDSPLITEQDRQQARAREDAAKSFVSRLTIIASEDGAKVLVDDVEIGTTPLREPALIDVGTRKIRVTKPGFKDYVREQRVVGASDIVLAARLEKELHRGRLVVKAGADALIAIDGKAVGLASWDGSLTSGGHTLRVTAPGMTSHQSEVLIKDNQTRTIQVVLDPLPPSGPPAWLWVIGGVALAGGAALGAAFLFQSEPAVEGSVPPGTVELSFGGRR